MDNIQNLQQEAQSRFKEQGGIGDPVKEIPNPSGSIFFFIALTTILLILKIVLLPSENIEDFGKENIVMKIIFIFYILTLLFGNYLLNTSTTTRMCNGTPQWGSTFIITFLPWILIFGIINVILIIFPGWLTPFSNTFGFLVVTLFGIKDLFNNKIIEEKEKWGGVKDDKIDKNIDVAKALQQIYGNESLLINEIPRIGDTEDERVENFKKFYETMLNLKIFKTDKESDGAKIELYKLLKIKDYVAEYVWFILTGILVASITYNYIVNIGCDFSSQQMRDSYQRFVNENLGERDRGDTAGNLQNVKDRITN